MGLRLNQARPVGSENHHVDGAPWKRARNVLSGWILPLDFAETGEEMDSAINLEMRPFAVKMRL